jgi:hypothetical protein
MELHVKIIGGCLIVLGIIHAGFPRRFNWQQELSSLSTMNREMMYVHTFFIALSLILIGVLCLISTSELTGTVLGKQICLGLGIFWTSRLLIQFFGYSTHLWKGKAFETTVHILFSIFWAYMSVVFILIYL